MLHILLLIILNMNPVPQKNKGPHVETRVKDNVSGIREVLSGKIFQHFFTTRPTGQGRGFGLSLAYDIVKANGGKINVEKKHIRAGMDLENGACTADKQGQYLLLYYQ
jgi:C4-dicarboxylate-specific signal transduction histidine kinase